MYMLICIIVTCLSVMYTWCITVHIRVIINAVHVIINYYVISQMHSSMYMYLQERISICIPLGSHYTTIAFLCT